MFGSDMKLWLREEAGKYVGRRERESTHQATGSLVSSCISEALGMGAGIGHKWDCQVLCS